MGAIAFFEAVDLEQQVFSSVASVSSVVTRY
jgi:hypothetical protein